MSGCAGTVGQQVRRRCRKQASTAAPCTTRPVCPVPLCRRTTCLIMAKINQCHLLLAMRVNVARDSFHSGFWLCMSARHVPAYSWDLTLQHMLYRLRRRAICSLEVGMAFDDSLTRLTCCQCALSRC